MSKTQEAQTQEAASAAAASGQGPPQAEVARAVEAAQAAARFQDAADALKKQASLALDPAERERLWTAAYMKEKEAHGESKKARVLASGWGQGAGMGIGLSAAVGMGLGNVLGAVLSGVVAVPGTLIGSGVGAIHGPWFKFKDLVGAGGNGDNSGGDGALDEKDISNLGDLTEDERDEKAHMAIVAAARQVDDEKANKLKDNGGSKDQPQSQPKKQSKETTTNNSTSEGKKESKSQTNAQPKKESTAT
ncbi:hypothetical protein BD289DRAFT_371792 [Coniella lustricola]|uniref:Uncharacterized protein n=1 Tax=Coniella lustricola TaxID=2025994 RepID=A0A2T3A392_9PEZI|nr:hypothetical protein BD289DRAFT_371792 [Coniella lustricola]